MFAALKKKLRQIFSFNRREITIGVLTLFTFMAFVPIFTYAYFASDLTSTDNIMNRNDTGVILLDRDGEPFYTFYQPKLKTTVPLESIPKHLQQAVISIEDKDFYSHEGFSIPAIIRSFYADLKHQKLAYGGSTITQQLVKNALLTPNKSFLRKYQEIVLAQEIERRYTKDEILSMYLNSVYFGEGAFGVEEAAQSYFNKSVSDLNLAESTILAGLLPSPNALSPINGDLEKTKRNQQMILQKMVEQGFISKEEADQAEKEKLTFNTKPDDLNTKAIHFALMVRDQLIKTYGEEKISRSGFKVKTTLDSKWQEFTEETVKNQVAQLKRNQVSNGAAVVIDPKTGEVKSLVGSFNWHDEKFGKVNVATSLRQPGSSFKPIVYVAGFEKRLINPSTVLKDTKTIYKYPGTTYAPQNYDNRFRGNVTVRRALANSLNVPAVEVMNKVGVNEGVEMGKRLGLTDLKDPSEYGLSLVLGAGEVQLLQLTSVYATFANNGEHLEPTLILEIDDKKGSKIYQHSPQPKKVLDAGLAFLISSILSDNQARQEVFGNALTISRPAAVKTGTTENYKDAWTLGYTPSLAVGVWVGNNDGAPMDRVAGSLGAAPIWRALMERFLAGTPVEKFNPPTEVIAVSICKEATASATYTEYFIKGTEPSRPCLVARQTVTQGVNSQQTSPAPDNNRDNRGQGRKKDKDD